MHSLAQIRKMPLLPNPFDSDGLRVKPFCTFWPVLILIFFEAFALKGSEEACSEVPYCSESERHLTADDDDPHINLFDLERMSIEKRWALVEHSYRRLENVLGEMSLRVDHGREHTLKDYLEGEQKESAEAVSFIETHLGRKLSAISKNCIFQLEKRRVHEALMIAFDRRDLSRSELDAIMLKVLPITPDEAIRLIENGIVHTANGHVVELKTGDTFGDIFSMPRENDERFRHAYFIDQIRKFLLTFTLGLLRNFNNTNGADLIHISENENWYENLSPYSLSAYVIAAYAVNNSTTLNNTLLVNPVGYSYNGAITNSNLSENWWVTLYDNYAGIGWAIYPNLNGQLWATTSSDYWGITGNIYGWKNYIGVGLGTASRAGTTTVGVSLSVSLTRTHEVKYQGQYPIDGKFKEIRGKHKLEITDNRIRGASLTAAANFSAASVPLTVAFRGNFVRVRDRIFRTYRDIKGVQEALEEGGAPGLAYIFGKSIENTEFPSFEEPEQLQVGDELIETRSGQLSGTFIVGVQNYVPIYAAYLGGNLTLKGDFVLGLKRLPQNKFEVSIEPIQVVEIGIFESMVNMQCAGFATAVTFSKKQVFVFDFNRKDGKAKQEYFHLIDRGQIPIGLRPDEALDNRSPEHMLSRFRLENKALKRRGIQRIYLETINISSKKFFSGIFTPVVGVLFNSIPRKANLGWAGLSNEYFRNKAKSLAINGILAVERKTIGRRKAMARGLSGVFTKDFFITHRRVFSSQDKANGDAINRWEFDSLLLHAELKDTVVTFNEENQMATYLDHLFDLRLGHFEKKNSRQSRRIDVERILTRKDLDKLASPEAWDHIAKAHDRSRVDAKKMRRMLMQIRSLGADPQAQIIEQFIECEGIGGFAAVHHLLGGKAEEILLHTEAGYANAENEVKTFNAKWANTDEKDKKRLTRIKAIDTQENARQVRKFYGQSKSLLKKVDKQLRLLSDDQYFPEDNQRLLMIMGKDAIKKMISDGKRDNRNKVRDSLVSARNSLLKNLDFSEQGYGLEERMRIYGMARKHQLPIFDQAEMLQHRFAFEKISPYLESVRIVKQLMKYHRIIERIDRKIKKLEEDTVMKKMDPAYVEKTLEKLKKTRRNLLVDISFETFTVVELERFLGDLQTQKVKLLCGTQKNRQDYYRAEGALEYILFQKKKAEGAQVTLVDL